MPWMNANDHLPPADERVLGWWHGLGMQIARLEPGRGWMTSAWGRMTPPTHWMRLPEPPEARA